jgi:hypothetical protein
VRTLHQKWICDKSSALCAAILAGTDLAIADRGERERLESATQFISANVIRENAQFLADSTLALLSKVPDMYRDHPDEELLPDATPLSQAVSAVQAEIERRNAGSQRLPDILIAHAVYLLKQSRLSMRDFLKWLKRYKERETHAIGDLFDALSSDESACIAIDNLLNLTRDASEQTRNRIDAVDRLYDSLLPFAPPKQGMLWWLRICLSLRSSQYCWPLMVAGCSEHGLHGISLPIGMFLSYDDKSKVYFKIVNPTGTLERRHYVRGKGDDWAHMEGSQLEWNDEWARAFRVGLRIAKKLWSSQNGRLRFVDEAGANTILKASLVVDVSAACAIVDSIFASRDGTPYRLSGRSAEAYWVQAVLGMMLPAREIPLGVVTGRVQVVDGVEEIRHVEGVAKKLEYANNAGFSRVVLPSTEFEAPDVGPSEAGNVPSDHVNNDSLASGEVRTGIPHSVKEATSLFPRSVGTARDGAGGSEDRNAENEVQAFRKSLEQSGARKKVEINFCRTVRNVADAMQISGWRRTAFIRLPETQRAFSIHLRRLFLKEEVERGTFVEDKDRRDYDRYPWTTGETRKLKKLDDFLLSETRAIKFVDRAKLEEMLSNGAEAEIGKWLAWKDHQVRGGSDANVHGPGLGILCVRSTETDNDMRLWSTIADTLSASPEWWNNFQWSGVDEAAQLLARLLGNRQANPSVCSTPAPDLLVLFDEGALTQRRTNPIFPDDFRGQWLDLLNASKENPYAPHALNEALLREGPSSLGCTRIVVVYGQPIQKSSGLPDTLDTRSREALERLAVFRFDFSKQAAYAMMNFGRPHHDRLTWAEVDETLETLAAKKALIPTRGRFYVEPRFLPQLRGRQFDSDPHAQVHAAKSLAPILEPRDLFLASNRDRTLEPESVLEATWHLQKARTLVPARSRKMRNLCGDTLSILTFLRPFPDWDTVKQLQRSPATLADAVELGRELLDTERSITHRPPHSSRVAALLNAMGGFGRSLDKGADAIRAELADEATVLWTNALTTLETLSMSDCRRQKCKLFSEYVYCMRMLGIPSADRRLAGALRYLGGTIDEVAKPDFYERRILDDYPLSYDWLKATWSDNELPLRERSTRAYVAARLNIGRWRDGELVRDPWDQPWIEYFSLTTTEDFDARQLKSPLTAWQGVYGENKESAEEFGRRIRDLVSYLPSKSKDALSWWGLKIRSATDNLWKFINHSEPIKQLWARDADVALRFIRIVVMYETLPAFDFIERRGQEWLAEWPKRLLKAWSSEWNEMAEQVVRGEAGWVSMLSSLSTFDRQSIELVRSWLHAYRTIAGDRPLYFVDPDKLLQLRVGTMQLADAYRWKRANAIWNGYQLLARRNQRGWAIDDDLRTEFMNTLRQLDGGSNSWFFAIASRKPHPRTVAGACMMLENCLSESDIREVANKPGLEHFRNQLLRNIPEWTMNASDDERAVFETLSQKIAPRETSGCMDETQQAPVVMRG